MTANWATDDPTTADKYKWTGANPYNVDSSKVDWSGAGANSFDQKRQMITDYYNTGKLPSGASGGGSAGGAGGGAGTGDYSSTTTPNAQLEALKEQQKDYAKRIDTNTTLAANVGRQNVADSAEGAKNAAKRAAAAAGRPWTNEDERQWSARQARTQQQNENAMTLQRDELAGKALTDQLATQKVGIDERQTGEQLNLSAQDILNRRMQAEGELKYKNTALEYNKVQSQAELDATIQYRQTQADQANQQFLLDQARVIASFAYGPGGGGGGGGGQQQAAGGYAAGGGLVAPKPFQNPFAGTTNGNAGYTAFASRKG